MEENPYAASPIEDERTVPPSGEATAQEVFWAWEKLRFVYNAILVGAVLIVSVMSLGRLVHPDNLGTIVGGALAANILFCLGPIGEGYVAHMGANRGTTRIVIFTLGTVLSVLLSLVTLMALMIR